MAIAHIPFKNKENFIYSHYKKKKKLWVKYIHEAFALEKRIHAQDQKYHATYVALENSTFNKTHAWTLFSIK